MDLGEAISSAIESALPPQQDTAVAEDADETLAPNAAEDGGEAVEDAGESEDADAPSPVRLWFE